MNKDMGHENYERLIELEHSGNLANKPMSINLIYVRPRKQGGREKVR